VQGDFRLGGQASISSTFANTTGNDGKVLYQRYFDWSHASGVTE
jgi:hypothetical protein